MQIHQLKPKTENRKPKRVGRGDKRGKTSGRGHKGQKARAGATPRPQSRDIIKAFPKWRGSGAKVRRKEFTAVNLSELENNYSAGEVVSAITLKEKGVVKGRRADKPIKILADGDISKKITVEGCELSAAAREKIEQAGGSVK